MLQCKNCGAVSYDCSGIRTYLLYSAARVHASVFAIVDRSVLKGKAYAAKAIAHNVVGRADEYDALLFELSDVQQGHGIPADELFELYVTLGRLGLLKEH